MKKILIALTTLILGGTALGAPTGEIELLATQMSEKPMFDTASGWIEPGQYALTENSGSYFVCETRTVCAHDIPLVKVPLDTKMNRLTEVSLIGTQHFVYYGLDRTDFEIIGEVDATKMKQKGGKMPTTTRSTNLLGRMTNVAEAAIAYDTTAKSSDTNVSTLTFAHTMSTGGDGVLTVMGAANTFDSCTADPQDITGVTYDGVAMTFSNEGCLTGGGEDPWGEMWYQFNPSTGTNNVVITWTNSVTDAKGGSISLTGVDNTAPHAEGEATGDSNAPSVTLTITGTDVWVIDGQTNEAGGSSEGSGQSKKYDETGVGDIAGSIKGPVSADTTMSWTISDGKWYIAAIAFEEAVGFRPTVLINSTVKVDNAILRLR